MYISVGKTQIDLSHTLLDWLWLNFHIQNNAAVHATSPVVIDRWDTTLQRNTFKNKHISTNRWGLIWAWVFWIALVTRMVRNRFCFGIKFQGLSQSRMPKHSGIGWSRLFVHQQHITWLLEAIIHCGPLLNMVPPNVWLTDWDPCYRNIKWLLILMDTITIFRWVSSFIVFSSILDCTVTVSYFHVLIAWPWLDFIQ